jgi:hypothetical protein
MNREISLGSIVALACLSAVMFFGGYVFHEFVKTPAPVRASRTAAATPAQAPAAEPVPAPEPAPEPKVAETVSHTIALMPGQSFNAPNKRFRKLEVRSEYPLEVASGPCHLTYTVEFFCESEPADFFIRDTRKIPVFLTPKANNVTITATEF